MKRNFFNYILLLTAFAGSTGCQKDFGDLNISPNGPSSPSTRYLFGSAVVNMTGIQAASGNLYVQYASEFEYNEESRYFNKIYTYDPIYAGPLMDLQTVIDLNTDPETKDTKVILENGSNANQLGPARILKAFLMLHITDRWGDIPYSESLKGVENVKPKFDKQRDIYNDLLKELKEASAQITAGLPNDPLFDGNAAAWKAWGNSLRAIVALRMADTEDAAIAKTAFTEAVTAGLISSNAGNAIFKYLTNSNFENPWYTNYIRQGRRDYGVSETVMNFLVSRNDPRLPIFASKASNTGTYVGIPYGKNASYTTSDFSLFAPSIYAQNAPLQITTYAQICFTMAEAALRGWIAGGDAEVAAWYDKGVRASMDQWASVSRSPVVTITEADKLAYLALPQNALPAVNALSFNEKLDRIQSQKWINFYMNNGFEAWAEWRRTGYPVLQPAADPLSADGQIPRRQCYPTTEKDLNGDNYKAVVAAQGADELATRMWWDK